MSEAVVQGVSSSFSLSAGVPSSLRVSPQGFNMAAQCSNRARPVKAEPQKPHISSIAFYHTYDYTLTPLNFTTLQ